MKICSELSASVSGPHLAERRRWARITPPSTISFFARPWDLRCLVAPHDAPRRRLRAAYPTPNPGSGWRDESVNVCRARFGNMRNPSAKLAFLSPTFFSKWAVLVSRPISPPRCPWSRLSCGGLFAYVAWNRTNCTQFPFGKYLFFGWAFPPFSVNWVSQH